MILLYDRKKKQYDDVWWRFNASTSLRDQFVALQTTCYIGKCKIYVVSSLTLAFTPFVMIFPIRSQSSTLAMAIKNLWLTFYSFFIAYFSKCMLNKHPEEWFGSKCFIGSHNVYYLDGHWHCTGVFVLCLWLELSCLLRYKFSSQTKKAFSFSQNLILLVK